jgi:hypothetical protein
MKNLLSLSFAAIIGCWLAPAQAMNQQNVAPEHIEIPENMLVTEMVGCQNEYTSVSILGAMFSPRYTPWGKLYQYLEHKNGRWQRDSREGRFAWRRKSLENGSLMIPTYLWTNMDRQIGKAGAGIAYGHNTYDPYGDIYGRD